MSFLIVPLLCLTSNAALAQTSTFDTTMTSPLSFEDEFLKADQAFKISFNQQHNKLNIRLEIAPDYYLYRHQFKFNGNQLTLSPIELPIGITHQDAYFGIQQIYKGQLSFSLNIIEASPNSSIQVTYQGCAAKGLCYPPTTRIVTIDKVMTGNK